MSTTCWQLKYYRKLTLTWGGSQPRRKQFESGGAHGERGARAYKGVWGRSPQRGPGAEPLVRGSGGRSPPEAEMFLGIILRKDRPNLPIYPTVESAEISPKHCLESKYAYGTQKNTHTHNVCVNVNRLNYSTRSASDVHKKLSYRRGTARCVMSIEILPIATQQCRNYLYDKS